jgi:hypothetical protein
MAEDERAHEIGRLRQQLADATARRTAALDELYDFAGRLPEIRAACGNPFFYSHPENVDESSDQYTAYSSHSVVLPTFLALRRIEHELNQVRERLRDLDGY